jgi:AcrR family transcriptional regulator
LADQLSAQDWLDQGLKTLAKSGFAALKAEPLAKAMGISRGSFYWHFADIGAFHAALLKHWREVTAERVIADLEAIKAERDPLSVLLGRAFSGRLTLERTVRNWASVDDRAREAVRAIDRRRIGYIEGLLREAGVSQDAARARAQILYWAFVGLAMSDQPLPKLKQQALFEELTRIARG